MKNCLGVVALLLAGCSQVQSEADAVERRHQEAVNRERVIVYNTDGCDMVYYPKTAAITPEAFTGRRLTHALGTKVSTISYCPLASGFGYFTSFKVGAALTNTVNPASSSYNATENFWKIGHDALEMALEFSRTNHFERFLSIRMNDSHDGSNTKAKPHPFFSKFKQEHPDCLMGVQSETNSRDQKPTTCYWQWPCVNYMKSEVREYALKFVRDFCENYDMEGIELDFCRHLMYVKNVVYGGTANDEERAIMTEFLAGVRAIVREYEAKRGHAILLTARVPDSVGYCRDIGFDLPAWLERKLLDALICGCYFNLEDPAVMADFVHGYGAKCYISIDESRIGNTCKRAKLPCIEGRDSLANYTARYAASMAAGADGVYLFNREYQQLHDLCQVDPRDTVGLDKLYFATERGPGGYTPEHYLVDGRKKWGRLPYFSPKATAAEEPAFSAEKPFGFRIRLADDFAAAAARGLRAKVELLALTRCAAIDECIVELNGIRLAPASSFADGLFTFEVGAKLVLNGINEFKVLGPAGKSGTLRDFAVRITYGK